MSTKTKTSTASQKAKRAVGRPRLNIPRKRIYATVRGEQLASLENAAKRAKAPIGDVAIALAIRYLSEQVGDPAIFKTLRSEILAMRSAPPAAA